MKLGKAKNIRFTQMQLQKLVYIAHGWNLAINNKPLTKDYPEAWLYGPVYRELHNSLKKYGALPINEDVLDFDLVLADGDISIQKKEEAIIKRVFKDYASFHAFQLSALTHQEGTPWTKVYNDGKGKYSTIPNKLIEEYFVKLAKKQ